MPAQETSRQFNHFAKKIVNVDELKTELWKVFKQESGRVGSRIRAFVSMNPDKIVDEASFAIHSFIIFSNNPEAKRLAYRGVGIQPVKRYLDAEAVCDLVSKGNLSTINKEAIFKAIEKAPDHAAKVAAGLIRPY